MKLSKILLPLSVLAVAISSLTALAAGSALASSALSPGEHATLLPYKQDYKAYLGLVEMIRQGLPLSVSEKEQYELLCERFGERDSRGSLDNRGGPDGFGYGFVDNQGGDTATYQWLELRGDANATWITYTNHDDGVSQVPIGFAFPFYGSNFENVTVSTNGNLQFASSSTSFSNACLPTTTFGGATMFVYWDDLHQDYGGIQGGANTIGYRNFGEYFVVEWDSVGHCCSAGSSYKFEAIFWADGRMKFQYNNIVFGANANTQTVGIQQSGTGSFLQYDCNAAGPQPLNELAIWFTPAESGTITGTVRNDSNEPIMGARVVIEGTTLAATTDNLGEFAFPIVGVGTWDLTASRRGHQTVTLTDIEVVVNENTAVDFELEDLGLLTFTSTNVPVPIPDEETATSTLEVTEPVQILDIDVMVNLTHTFDGDLIISLTSPAGTVVVLSDRNGGGGENFESTVFDDEADQAIGDGTAPFNGTFRPDSLLSAFDEESIEGTWTLTISDEAGADEGELLGWEIYVTPLFTGPRGTLSGTVREFGTNTPLIGVGIQIGEDWWQTNAFGDFVISNLDVGTYNVLFSMAGHCDTTVANVVINEDQTTTLEPYLRFPTPAISVTSISQTVVIGGTSQSNFDIGNSGSCALQFALADTAAWLSESPDDGIVSPGQESSITVFFNAAGLVAGTYDSRIVVTHNASGGTYIIPVTMDVILASDDAEAALPERYALLGNFPNPFNASTELRFETPHAGWVTLSLYNVLGQEIRTLVNQTLDAGRHVVAWDGLDSRGVMSPTGIYIVRMTAAEFSFTGKLMLLK